MAKAHKCDRCGKYYDGNLPETPFEEVIDGSTRKYGLCLYRLSPVGGLKDIDLCPECLDKLHSFFKEE